MNKVLITRIIGIVMILASIGFLVFSFIATQNYVKTEATVVSVEYDSTVTYDPDDDTTRDDHIVTMEYVVDGKTYQTVIHAQQGDYSIGQKTEIRYNPANPQNVAVGEMNLPIIIGICAAAVIIGAIIIIKGK